MAHGADRLWVFSCQQGQGMERLETWHHNSGDLEDVAVSSDSEKVVVTMISSSGRISRRSLGAAAASTNGNSENQEKNGGGATSFSSQVSLAAVCQEDEDLHAMVGRGRLAVFANSGDGFGASELVAEVPLEDELNDVTAESPMSVRWERRKEIVVVFPSEVQVFKFLRKGGNVISLKFCHDGHRADISDFASHPCPSSSGLFFSADRRGSLHAWAPSAEAAPRSGIEVRKRRGQEQGPKSAAPRSRRVPQPLTSAV